MRFDSIGWALALMTVNVAYGGEAAVKPQGPLPLEIRIVSPAKTHVLTLKDLRKKLAVTRVTVDDPVYQSKKTYEAVPLEEVLRLGGAGDSVGDDLVFHCADGYAPTLPLEKLKGQKGYLAFRDTTERGGDGWKKVLQGKTWLSPAPFYVVWEGPLGDVPWAYQVVGLEVVRFAQKFNRIFPTGVERTDPIYLGFQIFKSSCLKCHSLNLQGGDQGPELNYPKNILEYWDRDTVRQFVRDPESFRVRSKMPKFDALTDDDFDRLFKYWDWVRGRKGIDDAVSR